jgi:hypothetical protein
MEFSFNDIFAPPAKTQNQPATASQVPKQPTAATAAIKPLPEASQIERSSWFVFDLETVPDETRSPKPEVRQPAPRPPVACDLADLLTKPITHIRPMLARLAEPQLQELAAIETAGKNRSTLLNAIADEVQLLTGCDMSAVEEWKKLSFNPFGCRVVAVGVAQKNAVFAEVARNIDEERVLLRKLWGFINTCPTRVGYNINAFDDAVIIARSIMLGLEEPATPLDRRRFGNRQAIDLMTALFPAGQPMKLKELCRLLQIVPPAGYEMSGDKVLQYVEAGDYETVLNYVHSDAIIERELFSKLRGYVVLD